MVNRGERFRLGAALKRWRYAEAGRRDVRLDLLRGYAVFAMVSDHVAGISWISPLTGANRFMVSAAEGFVFLAGLVLGMVFGGRIKRDGWQVGAEGILRRAVILYLVTVGLTLFFVGLFQFTNLRLWLDRAYGLGLTDPVELVVGTLTLHYTYHGTDILWMYTILISASPLIFLLLCLGYTPHLLAGSWLLWLVYQLFPAQAAVPWVATNVNYFPVAAWQVIFVNGLIIGWHRDRVGSLLSRLPMEIYLLATSIGMFGLVVVQRAHDTGRLAGWPLVGRLAGELYLTLFDKPSLAPGRLLAFAIVFGFAFSLVTLLWVPLRRALGWLMLPLGTNSLRAYGIHLLVIVVVYNVEPLARLYDRSRTGNTILQLVTVGLTFLAVVGWRRVEQGVSLPSVPLLAPSLVRRPAVVAAAAFVILALTAGGAALAGPVRASRQSTMAEAPAEAGLLQFVPDGAIGGSLPVLLVLHDADTTGPEFARPLIDAARANGWAVIAPTVIYGEWSDPNQVAADAADLLPRLDELVEGLDERPDANLRPRVLVYGAGRGAHAARHFALLYPDRVAAVAAVGPAPCTLPAESLQGEPLPFPFGVDDVDQYTGAEFNEPAFRHGAFWVGLWPGGDESSDQCEWGPLAGLPPKERAARFVDALTQLGVTGEWVSADSTTSPEELRAWALAFLEANQARTMD